METLVCLDSTWSSGDHIADDSTPDSRSLITFLCGSLAVLWKDWPKHMELTVLESESGKFSLRGQCPHCHHPTVFTQVTSVHAEEISAEFQRLAVGMLCQGCLKHILAIAMKTRHRSVASTLAYLEHYPLGVPDDSVHSAVPISIAADFSEALRCFFIRSYKACVAMCRRSVEASCHDLGAKGNNLKERIDNLAATGRITEPLKDMAHKVRLTANEELHGKPEDLDMFTEPEAEGIVEFVREYFHHVYVMPEKLANYGKPHTPATP